MLNGKLTHSKWKGNWVADTKIIMDRRLEESTYANQLEKALVGAFSVTVNLQTSRNSILHIHPADTGTRRQEEERCLCAGWPEWGAERSQTPTHQLLLCPAPLRLHPLSPPSSSRLRHNAHCQTMPQLMGSKLLENHGPLLCSKVGTFCRNLSI